MMDKYIGQPMSAFASRAFETLARTTAEVVRTEAAREEVYRLRYRAYLAEGAIAATAGGTLSDDLDPLPNVCTVAVRHDGRLVGSIRFALMSRSERRSSASRIFADLLAPYLDDGHLVLDPSRFVTEPEQAERLPELPYLIARIPMMAAVHFGARYGLATPRAEHYAFYRRVLNARTLSTPVPFPGLIKPVGLMIQETLVSLDYVRGRYPFMAPRPGEAEALFGGVELREPAEIGS